MDIIILLLLIVGIYALHRDHIVLADGLNDITEELDRVLKHLEEE